MNIIAALLLLTSMTIPTQTLVLSSGKRIPIDGSLRIDDGRVLFRSGGTLYSIAAEEVDLDASQALGSTVTVTAANEKNMLKVPAEVRERLLRDLEQNHGGAPATREQLEIPPPPPRAERQAAKQDEWTWKNAARQQEEQVRRAHEELDLLVNRVDELKSQIVGFLNLGYKPSQFSYQTTQLAYVQEQIPHAEVEVRRAERAYMQFLDDARRQGVMPGWLR